MNDSVTVSISIDTEEDDWGSYARGGASTKNISHLAELQDLFDRWGARPTYLVNRAPLVSKDAVEVLGRIAAREGVEIGAHCHPWNTPPFGDQRGPVRTMMCTYSVDENRAKLREVKRCLAEELGVVPRSFRTGRWGLGPTVAGPLAEEGFEIDCSVSPFIDWSAETGPDYSEAPHLPYRFDPEQPLVPAPAGALLQLPTTIGFLRGDPRRRAALRRRLEKSWLRRLKVVGLLDEAGVLSRRWLSPETSDGETMVRLAAACVVSGQTFLQLTFHSCTLLPGATPFVRDAHDRAGFLASVDRFLSHSSESGFTFRNLAEAGAALSP
jgi:hypothetical protein